MAPAFRADPPPEEPSFRAAGRKLDPVARELECLYVAQAPTVMAYLRGNLGMDRRTAEDITHIAFLRLGSRMSAGPPIGDLVPYLFKIAKNEGVSWLRTPDVSKSTLVLEPVTDHADPASEDPYERIIYLHDHRKRLDATRAALAQLPSRQREIVILHDLSGLSSTQIAELIGISEGTARYHLSMARRRLKKILRLGSQKEGDGNES